MSIGIAEFASHGNMDAVIRMLRDGADINAYYPARGTTALMEACKRGNKEMFDLLLAHHADINMQNIYTGPEGGKTALDYALDQENEQIIGTLLERGAKTKDDLPEFVTQEQPKYSITSVGGPVGKKKPPLNTPAPVAEEAKAIGEAMQAKPPVSLDKQVSRAIRKGVREVFKGMKL